MKKGLMLFVGLVFVLGVAAAQAAVKDMKTYKEAFPGAAIKCIGCHVDAMPKKDDGKHDLNAYGKATEAATVDAYKKAGKVEDFKK